MRRALAASKVLSFEAGATNRANIMERRPFSLANSNPEGVTLAAEVGVC